MVQSPKGLVSICIFMLNEKFVVTEPITNVRTANAVIYRTESDEYLKETWKSHNNYLEISQVICNKIWKI